MNETMTPRQQAARDAAVARLVAAGWDGDSVAIDPCGVAAAIYLVAPWVVDDGNGVEPLDVAALHALFLLGAALTAPAPATCAPGCVRLAVEGPGHPGACGVPETGGGR